MYVASKQCSKECLLVKYNTIQYNTIQYNTIQYNTIQYNTIQYNTIQYNGSEQAVLHSALRIQLVPEFQFSVSHSLVE